MLSFPVSDVNRNVSLICVFLLQQEILDEVFRELHKVKDEIIDGTLILGTNWHLEALLKIKMDFCSEGL